MPRAAARGPRTGKKENAAPSYEDAAFLAEARDAYGRIVTLTQSLVSLRGDTV